MKKSDLLSTCRQVPRAALCATVLLACSGLGSVVEAGVINVPPGGSIHDAIDGAVNGDVIQLEQGSYLLTETIIFDGNDLSNITLRGAPLVDGLPVTSIDGNQSIRVIEFQNGIDVVLENVRIINGRTPQEEEYGGGLLCVKSTLTLNHCVVEDNWSFKRGGGLYCSESTLAVNNSSFFCNEANTANTSSEGGGVYCAASYTNMTNCTFRLNTASAGGGVANYGAGINSDVYSTFSHCEFDRNEALPDTASQGFNGQGGGMWSNSPNADDCDDPFVVTVEDCLFKNNTAGGNGGASYQAGVTGNYAGCTFDENHAGVAELTSPSGSGGAVYGTKQRNRTYTDCTFNNNTAASSGGALFHRYIVPCQKEAFSVAIESCTFTGNVAGDLGGALYNKGQEATINNSNFFSNLASGGGGLYHFEGAMELHGCKFQNNTATVNDGGGMYIIVIPFQPLVVTDTVLTDNMAHVDGGGVYVEGGLQASATFTSCNLSSNSAEGAGGGMFFDNGGVSTIEDCNVVECSAADGGGGIFFPAGSGAGTGESSKCSKYTLTNSKICGNSSGQSSSEQTENCCIDGGGNCITACCLDCGLDPYCPSDFNGDLIVDGFDLTFVLNDWGCTGDECSGDLNQDGDVNGPDLAIILATWGLCDC